MKNRKLLRRILSGDKGALEEVRRDSLKDINFIMAWQYEKSSEAMSLTIMYKNKTQENIKATSKAQIEQYFQRAENTMIIKECEEEE